MNKKQIRLTYRILFSSLILLILSSLSFYWFKLAGFSLMITGSIEFLTFLFFAISVITLVIRLVRHAVWRNRKNYLLLIYSLFFLAGYFSSTFVINVEQFLSPVKYRACYEGTMNTSRLVFRKDGTFEDYNIGFFAYARSITGTWTQKSDTLELIYDDKKLDMLGEKLLIKHDTIYSIRADTISSSWYYMGDCKGLN